MKNEHVCTSSLAKKTHKDSRRNQMVPCISIDSLELLHDQFSDIMVFVPVAFASDLLQARRRRICGLSRTGLVHSGPPLDESAVQADKGRFQKDSHKVNRSPSTDEDTLVVIS